MRVIAMALVVFAVTALPAGAEPAAPYVEGPDVPATTPPDAVLRPFSDERWSYTEGSRRRTVTVPETSDGGAWDRIIIEYASRPDGDPWDRLWGVTIDGVEVIRGTTPRTAFTVRKDITEYAALLPPGERVQVGMLLGTWVGALLTSTTIEFYDGETAPRPALDDVRSAFSFRPINGAGQRAEAVVQFDEQPPASAVVEVGISGHGQTGEFWYLHPEAGIPPEFEVLVDDQVLATITAPHWHYALAGTTGNNGDNGPVWWSAHRALDVAGVHTGVGIVPPYRATLDADEVALLAGARTVSVRQRVGGATWPTSLHFLLDGVAADNCRGAANADQADSDSDGVGDACEGARIVDASGVRDGGPISEGDLVTLTYDAPVSCSGADPQQFTYDATPALGVRCDGSSKVVLTLPDARTHAVDHGRIAYTASADPAAWLRSDEGPVASPEDAPVLVTTDQRPFLVGAGAVVDGSEEVRAYYSEPVQCGAGAAASFTYDGVRAAWSECDGTTVLLGFPAGTVTMTETPALLQYAPAAGAASTALIQDEEGTAAVAPDEERVPVSAPS